MSGASMNVFMKYAEYYDLLYHDKDYEAEVAYIQELINKYSPQQVKSILDIGCGTGKHGLILARHGYEVYGIDRASDMIAVANKIKGPAPNLDFAVHDALTFQLHRTFDAVVSLFHVISYQISDESLESFLKNTYKHLKDNGLFIFDFWYGPAVLAEKPEVRVKRAQNKNIELIRIAEPFTQENKNSVTIQYEIFIKKKDTGILKNIKEEHTMRYFFSSELNSMLKKAGFSIIKRLAWLSYDHDVSAKIWSGIIVAKKSHACEL
jgi:SAM-dependent methyltransferase